MKLLYKLLLLLALLCFACIGAEARPKYQGIAGASGSIVTSGISSTTKAITTYPLSTITVYQVGTLTLAALYSDDAGTPKSNPFTAGSDASYSFFVDAGKYDIKFSGTGITVPFTLGSVNIVEAGDSGHICDATNRSESDVGAKINACDTLLGSSKGTITFNGGGTMTTDVVLSSNHTLQLGAGTIQLGLGLEHNAHFRFKDDSTIEGAGNATIIKQSAGNHDSNYLEFIAIQGDAAYNSTGSVVRNIIIRNLQLQVNRADFDSVRAAVLMGNCHHCLVENLLLDRWGTIGIAIGGGPSGGTDPYSLGHYSDDVTVTKCTFLGVASQNLAAVNSRNFHFTGNTFIAPGQAAGPSLAVIDLETNTSNDLMEGFEVADNIIDARLSPVTVNGISYTSISAQNGPGLISHNQVWGRTIGGAAGNLSNGIIATGNSRDVSILSNTIVGAGQQGIAIGGLRFTVTGNTLTDTGGSSSASITATGVTNSIFINNRVYSPDAGYGDSLVESSGATNNSYFGNFIPNGSTIIGTSRVFGEDRGDGKLYNYSAGANGTIVFQYRTQFNGSTSGSTTLQAAAISGTTNLTLPAATDTLVGKATTDTLTNKTFDTAGTGNSLAINGVAATANTGTGAVVRATSPALVTPTLGAAAATSISFGGSTLSTYVEGTCTLTLKFGGATTGITTSSNVCKYQQVGNMVHIKLEMVLTSKGSATGSATLTGLPVNASTTANFQQVGFLYLVGSYTGTTNIFTDTATPSQLLLYVNNAGTGAALADTNFTNASIIILNLAYTTN